MTRLRLLAVSALAPLGLAGCVVSPAPAVVAPAPVVTPAVVAPAPVVVRPAPVVVTRPVVRRRVVVVR